MASENDISLNETSPNLTDVDEFRVDTSTLHFSYFICLGIIIFLGYIFNGLSIAVFIKSKTLRQTTTGLYLLALAVADILFLTGHMLRWLGTKNYIPNYTFLSYSDAACQFVYSLRYSAKLTSAWITVVITAERLYIIAAPLRAMTICTTTNARIAIIMTYFICFVSGCLSSVTLKVVEHNGTLMCGYHNPTGYRIYNWIILRVGSLLLPGTIIIVLSIIICVKLVRASETRRQELAVNNAAQAAHANVQRQLTAMLLAVAIAFVALRLPYTICFYINDLKVDPDPYIVYYKLVAYKVTDIFAALNYSMNFFLYCLTGTAFRNQFFQLFSCDATSGVQHVNSGHWTISTKLHHGVSKMKNNPLYRRYSKTDDGNNIVRPPT